LVKAGRFRLLPAAGFGGCLSRSAFAAVGFGGCPSRWLRALVGAGFVDADFVAAGFGR
jgi:hypothetical protein